MSKGIVISLYDFTGEALKPWADAGYTCYAFDIQHDQHESTTRYSQAHADGSIEYRHADLHDQATLNAIQSEFADKPVVFGMAFPVCTDMAVSGAAHFKRKAEANPFFQADAVGHATAVARMFNGMAIPYFIENPVSVLATLWRKPDHRFHPYEFGGYIPDDQIEHPRWPEYIAPRDAYPKKTCLWTGGGFKMPTKVAVTVKQGYAKQHLKLGGKSQRTKDIRSATPRGFAIAIYEANRLPNIQEYI
tara:strand:- start:579 stop:1319 length:741 start_codon:yes stop_codon:yes gene_type:complete